MVEKIMVEKKKKKKGEHFNHASQQWTFGLHISEAFDWIKFIFPQCTWEGAWEEKLEKAAWHTHHPNVAGMVASANVTYSWQAQQRTVS